MQRCEYCQKFTPVVGLLLPGGHETLQTDLQSETDSPVPEVWEAAEERALLFDVEHLPDAVQARLRRISRHYHQSTDGDMPLSSWLNHCSFCGEEQADFDLYCEPEGAFSPISPEAAKNIRLFEVEEPFRAQAAGYAYAPAFLEYAQILR
jgi:hypothetical protein